MEKSESDHKKVNVTSLLDQMARTPRGGHDSEWLRFITETLRLPACYLPAAQAVLAQGAWRRHTGKGQNPIGYIKKAVCRVALRQGLAMDLYKKDEPYVKTKDQSLLAPLNLPRGFEYEDFMGELSAGSTGLPEKTESGTWSATGGDDYEYRIPEWLQRGDEYDAVDWETVAVYAAQKPRMVCALAKTLIFRFEDRCGRPQAVAQAVDEQEAHEIEAAWKWIDRNWQERIAPLFQMQKPPSREIDTSGLPMLTDRLSLRLDMHLHWDGSRLALMRRGLTPDEDGGMSAYVINASSLPEAVQMLRAAAHDGESPELFHVWQIATIGQHSELSIIDASGG